MKRTQQTNGGATNRLAELHNNNNTRSNNSGKTTKAAKQGGGNANDAETLAGSLVALMNKDGDILMPVNIHLHFIDAILVARAALHQGVTMGEIIEEHLASTEWGLMEGLGGDYTNKLPETKTDAAN